MRPRGAFVVVFGLLLAGCNLSTEPGDAKVPQSSSKASNYELFFNGKPIEPSKYVRMRSVENLMTIPEDMRYDLRKALSRRELDALSVEKRQLLDSAKPNSEPPDGAVGTYTFVRSLQAEDLELFPEDFKRLLRKGLTEEQLSSLSRSARDALKTVK